MTHKEALAIYRAGEEVVFMVFCEMSDKIESLQKRASEFLKNCCQTFKEFFQFQQTSFI